MSLQYDELDIKRYKTGRVYTSINFDNVFFSRIFRVRTIGRVTVIEQ